MMIQVKEPENVGFSRERLNRISKGLESYVFGGDLAGVLTLVERKGEVVHLSKCGYQDIASQKELAFDSIFRIYSMTKPITSVALLMLFEQGRFQLSDPISKFLPELNNAKVLGADGELIHPKNEITIHRLLTHTAGLTYGVFVDSPVDKMYQDANLFEKSIHLGEMVQRISNIPLFCHPGERWVYSVATDVVGRLVEILSGKTLADYFQENIFSPLGMVDTSFSVPSNKIDRLTTCYAETKDEKMAVFDGVDKSTFRDVKLYSGGGGLLSTLEDYLKFSQLLRNKGKVDGTRLLGRKTVEMMTSNHLSESLLPMRNIETMPGLGFGLGVSVLLDVLQFQCLGSEGSYGWSGLASTTFWVDPQEEMIAILMTQYIALESQSLHADFRNLVYQALVD